MLNDLRRAARRLAREPGLSAAAIVTLAVGIGASAAMFSIVEGVLLRSMGITAPDRLVVMWPLVNEAPGEFTYNAYRHIARATAALDAVTITGSANWPARFVLDGTAVELRGAGVSSTFFDVMGAAPVLGRTFRPDDDVPGAPQVIVISDGLWAKHFARNPDVIGRTIDVQEDPGTTLYEVVGVAGPAFFYPHGAEYWFPAVPFIARSAGGDPLEPVLEGLGVFHAIGRLRPEQSAAAARADVNRLWRARREADGTPDNRIGIGVTPLLDHTFGRARQALALLMGAVLLLLFSACANVAGLLIARGASRTREMAVRVALGATRWTLVRQLLAEGALLAVFGAIVGVSIAAASLEGLLALSPAAIPRLDTTRLDASVLIFAVAITAGATVLLALIPAWSLRRSPAIDAQGQGKGTVGRSSRAGVRHALVVLQVATGVVLLVATGLTVRSFIQLSAVDTGYRAEHVLMFDVSGLNGTRYPERTHRHTLIEQLVDRFGHVPGVQATSAILLRPFGAGAIGWDSAVWLQGQEADPNAYLENPTVNFEVVTPNYFRSMGIPIVRGRDFQTTDAATVPPVAILSENLAARLWPGDDAIGQRLVESFTRGDGTAPLRWLTVVGVAGSAVYREIDRPRFDLYLPLRQAGTFDTETFVVRTSLEARSFVEPLAAEAVSVDAGFSLADIATLDEILGDVRGPWRFNMLVFGLFGIVSTALTAIGLFGLMSYTVTQRRREFGIRLALGAEGRRVWRMVVLEGAALGALGLLAGLLMSLAATRTIASLLFEVSATDRTTLAGASLVLAAVTLLACYLPARRAASVDPAIVLRDE